MKILSPLLVLATCCSIASAQTTTCFQPGPAVGKDANIWTVPGCIPANMTATPGDVNFGNTIQLPYMAWSWNGAPASCWTSPLGTIRSLIEFTELNSIPPSSLITNATISFNGMQSPEWGANSYPNGTTYPENPGFLRRITAPWNEQTVTYNTQPPTSAGTGTTDVIALPPSAALWGWNPSFNITAMVQSMVSGVNPNYGFLLQLQNEVRFRSVFFASSDHTTASKRPKLCITYQRCTDFEYCFNSGPNQMLYSFSVIAPVAGSSYSWKINGTTYATGASFQINLLTIGTVSTPYNIELVTTDNQGRTCSRFHQICPWSHSSLPYPPSCAEFSVCTKTNEPYTAYMQALVQTPPAGYTYVWSSGGGTSTNPNVYTYITNYGGPNMGGGAFLSVQSINPPTTYLCQSSTKICFYQNQARPANNNNADATDDGSLPQSSDIQRPGEIAVAATAVYITPNPATTDWNLQLNNEDNDDKVQLNLLDINGKLISSQSHALNAGINKITIAGNQLAPGIYILEIRTSAGILKEKLIKTR